MKITVNTGLEKIDIYFHQLKDGFYDCYKSENDINNYYEDIFSAVVNGFVEFSFVKKDKEKIFDKKFLKDIDVKYTHQKKYEHLPFKDALALYSLTYGSLYEIYLNDVLVEANESLENLESRLKDFEVKEFK